jgi:hypothetical protein
MRKLLAILLAFTLAACSLARQTEIDRNREKWQAAAISHYRYELFVGCFCVFSQDMPLIVEVQDGKVLSMEYQSGNEIDAENRQLFERYATIDRIFAWLSHKSRY